MARLTRLERWSDRESNGGTRLDFCRAEDVVRGPFDLREVSGREELDFGVAPDHPWATSLRERNVVRTVFDGGAFDEWRCWSYELVREQDGTRRFDFLCRSMKWDLSDELAIYVQAGGQAPPHHELGDITVDDFIDSLINLPTWPSDFTKGTVEPTTRNTWVIDWDTYLAALHEAAKVSGGELDVRRNGASGYIVDLVNEVRAGERTEIRFAANALEAHVERDWSEAGTLIYPKGEGPQGASPTIADMRWFSEPQPGESSPTTLWRLRPWDGTGRLTGWPGLLSTSDSLVCTEDDQFNGLYFAGIEIVDSAPAEDGKAIDVELATSLSSGQLRWIREDADGTELLYVPVPSKIATHGRRAFILERDDIPGITNMVTLPFTSGKQGVHWDPYGSPTVTAVNVLTSPYVRYGTTAMKIEAETDEGVSKYAYKRSAGVDWMVSSDRPHLSFQVFGWLESGSVRFEVFFVFVSPIADAPDTGQIYRFPTGTDGDGKAIEARAIKRNAPFHMTIEPALFNFSFSDGQVAQVGSITNLELRVTAREPGTVFYLDAFQVVNHPTAGEKIVSGASMNQLWDAACRAIQRGASEPEVRLRTTALDFDRLGYNPLTLATYTYGAVHPGVTARIVDPGIGLEEERRICSVKRDLKNEAITSIELAEA